MRMRKKKNLVPRMEKTAKYLFDCEGKEELRAADIFGADAPLYIEIGCGKGRFICEQAKRHPECRYIGVERVPDVLVLAMEKAEEYGLDNLRYISFDAANLGGLFAGAAADGIYLNFSDPWPKNRHTSRRLDGPGFLVIYKKLLKPGAALEMKTDNIGFFEFGLESLDEAGWHTEDISRDLTAEARPENIVTEYEQRWSEQGIKINYVKATP